jgi:hypothetical protein
LYAALIEVSLQAEAVGVLLDEAAEVMGVEPSPFRGRHMELDDIRWDRDEQQFEIMLSCRFGIATAGEHADFKIVSNLDVHDGDSVINLCSEDGISIAEGAEKDRHGFIELDRLYIPWERVPRWTEGVLKLNLNLVLYNPNDGGMTQIDPPSLDIDGGVPDDDDD